MKSITKRLIERPGVVILTVLFLILQTGAFAQASISGPTCVVPGVPYNYSISAFYSGTANFTYSVSGGTLSTGGTTGTHTGPGVASVTITWTGNGVIVLSSPAGGTNYSVTSTTAYTAGTITSGGAQTINYGTTPATINCSLPTGGTCVAPRFVYQWQQSPDNVHFVDLSGATSQNLSFSAGATQTTYYRRFSTETTGNNSAYSNTASVVLNPPNPILAVNGGSILPSSQNINYNTTSATLTNTGVSGGTYTYSFQWQTSPDNSTWTNIPNYVSTYSPGNLAATIYYRVAVTSNGVTAYSGSALVNVYPRLIAGTIVPASINISSGGSPGGLNCTPATGGNGTYAYQWQSSTDGTNFSNVGGATSLFYTPPGLTVNTWYRLMATSNGVAVSSNMAQVTIVSATPDVNFVRTRDILKAGIVDSAAALALTNPMDVTQITTYFDGLGREIQTVAMQQSPRMKDLVTFMQYDGFGRETYKYLPYTASTGDGNYKATALADEYNFNAGLYPGEQYYFGQSNYEPSPLNRVVGDFAPGISWNGSGRGITKRYQVNTISDSVRIWTISNVAGSIPTSISIFAAGSLYENQTVDEAGHVVVQYVDIEGKMLLKKVQLAASPGTAHVGWLCTYYVYDVMRNLRFVLPPLGVQLINGSWNITTPIANELCFRYEYDQRRRLSIKKIPGAGEQWMVYDTKNRLVISQDSLLRGQKKWMFMRYDTLNRADSTGLLTDLANYNNLSFHQNSAANSTNYPVVASYPNELLTQTYFDDYGWAAGAGMASTMATGITSNGNYFVTSYNASPVYAVNPIPFYITRGQTTGSRTKVIGSASQYLYSANFYDDRGRVIQSQQINYTGAVDTVTLQFDFTGKSIRNVVGHRKNGNTAQNHVIVSKMDYDHAFRLRHIYKNIDNAPVDQLIDSLQYNEVGQLSAKYLGNALDSLVYDYNIRGWVTGINKRYVTGATSHYFGMELGYNNTTSALSGATYANPQFNGNIGGTIWKGGGDGINRKYDFSYDNVNRLTKAAFTQNTTGSWDSSVVNYSVSNLAYDANGNILTMNQAGLKLNSSALIDQLTYTYAAGSNKLNQVADVANDSLSILGDFHFKGTKSPTDYGYDGNGSMTHDNNKGIDTIIYNYLNLPQQVHMKGKGNILYTYDAGGNRLTKVTMDSLSRHATTILYVGGFVYQQRDTITAPTGGLDTLQFVGHEEGRARWAFHRYTTGITGYKWEYDFFEKDHLGNTREVLTQQKDTAQYMATMEAAYRATENALFYNIGSTNVWSGYVNGAGNNPFGTGVTNPNDSVCRISGSTPKEGPAIILKVMAGDIYKVGVQGYWKSGQTSTGSTDATQDILNSLANGIVSLAGSTKGSFSSLSNIISSPLLAGVNAFRTANNPTPPSNPKAYLNYIVLDNQFNYDPNSSGAQALGGADVLHPLADSIVIKKNGYLYIYLTNETKSVSVFFDNLSVTHYSGPLLEENHYYPFGLVMAGISDKALKTQYAENKNKFGGKEMQNKEFSDGSGLEEYDFNARGYDPQIGRWHEIDPLAEYMRRWSPYAYGFDNPVRFADGNGMVPGDSTAKPTPPSDEPTGNMAKVKTLATATVTAHKSSSVLGSIGNFLWGAVDYIPFGGSIKQIGTGIAHGSWKEAGLGVLMLGVDAFSAGEGGEAIRLAEKGAQILAEDEVKEIAEKELEEELEKGASKTFDEAREEAFDNAGMKDGEYDMEKAVEKADPATGTLTEFKGEGGKKVGYDSPHESPGPHHDKQHISWQSSGKRGTGGASRGNIPYDGPRHPSRPSRK